MGRPSEYTPERAEAICARLAVGETLRSICRDPDMPDRETVRRWREAGEEFRGRYARAREAGLDHLADELMQIADDGTGDTWVDDDGHERTNSDVIARSKLRVDTRKWLLSKLAPRKYGERLELEHTGNADKPVALAVAALPAADQAALREIAKRAMLGTGGDAQGDET